MLFSPLSSSSSPADRYHDSFISMESYQSLSGSREHNKNCWCCALSSCKRKRSDNGESGECDLVHFLDIPGPWDYSEQSENLKVYASYVFFLGQFQSLVKDNFEYLILVNKLLHQLHVGDNDATTGSDFPPIATGEIELLS